MPNDSIILKRNLADNNFCNGQKEKRRASAFVRKQETDGGMEHKKQQNKTRTTLLDRLIDTSAGVLTKTREVATSSPDPAEAKQTPMAKSRMP